MPDPAFRRHVSKLLQWFSTLTDGVIENGQSFCSRHAVDVGNRFQAIQVAVVCSASLLDAGREIAFCVAIDVFPRSTASKTRVLTRTGSRGGWSVSCLPVHPDQPRSAPLIPVLSALPVRMTGRPVALR